MIRLTLILALAIFAILVLVPDDEDAIIAEDGAPGTDGGTRTISGDDALRERSDGTIVLVTETGEELVVARVIEPSELTAEDAIVNLPPAEASGALEPTPDAPATAEGTPPVDAPAVEPQDTETATAATPGATRLRVTGDRVNFRAGPSTDTAILAALTLGTEVELIERVGDGWAHLRVPATGLTGYMSGDFLEPAN